MTPARVNPKVLLKNTLDQLCQLNMNVMPKACNSHGSVYLSPQCYKHCKSSFPGHTSCSIVQLSKSSRLVAATKDQHVVFSHSDKHFLQNCGNCCARCRSGLTGQAGAKKLKLLTASSLGKALQISADRRLATTSWSFEGLVTALACCF